MIKVKETGSVCRSWQNCIRLTSISQQTLILRIVCDDGKAQTFVHTPEYTLRPPTHVRRHAWCASSKSTNIHLWNPRVPKTALDFLERCLPWKRLWAKWQGSQRCFKSRVIVSSPLCSIYIVRPAIISARLRLHASPLLHWPRNVSCIPSICGTMHVLQIKRII